MRAELVGTILGCGLLTAVAARGDTPRPIDTAFRAAYPQSAAAKTNFAGVALDRLFIAGLQLHARSDHAPDDGGIALSFADRAGVVRVLLRVAVCADAVTARRVLDTELHGISSQLGRVPDASLGDSAWADGAGKGSALVVGTQGNIAYVVDVVNPAEGMPTAATIAGLLRAAMVAGAPSFPSGTLTLSPQIDARRGGDVRIEIPGGHPYKLRAEGGYIARSSTGPLVRPFHAGPVTVYATITDNLGRVTVTSTTAVAR